MKKENGDGEIPIEINPLGGVIIRTGGLDRFMEMPTEGDIKEAIKKGDVEVADAMRCGLAMEDAL